MSLQAGAKPLPCAICTSICRSVDTICSALQFFRLCEATAVERVHLSEASVGINCQWLRTGMTTGDLMSGPPLIGR